jgi:LmbE family N-acetylglucosaminyl deacetylase
VPDEPASFLEALCAGTAPIDRRVAIVVAHPDDETIGLGAQLARFRDLLLVHVTDGAPRSRRDAADYAATRRRELDAMLGCVGIPRDRAVSLGVADQAASFHVVEIARRVADLLAKFRPAIALTHAYEGGHPDHDATCFAVHAACALLDSSPACGGGQGGGRPPHAGPTTERRRVPPPAPPPPAGEESNRAEEGAGRLILEFPLYRAAANPSGWALLEFLPGPPGRTVELDAAREAEKRRLVECFASQRRMLAQFPLAHERYRSAPAYDFAAPPHEGQLFYERYEWGVTGAEWRRLAGAAACELAR